MPDGSIESYAFCGCEVRRMCLVMCGFAYREKNSRNIQKIILILSWASVE